MNKLIVVVLVLLVLEACEQESRTESVEELLANPARLKEVQRLCKENRREVNEQMCTNAAIAHRKRFMGDGETRYTPSDPVLLMQPLDPK